MLQKMAAIAADVWIFAINSGFRPRWIFDIFVGGAASEAGRRMSSMGSHREGFSESEAMRTIVSKSAVAGGDNGFTLYDDGGVSREQAGFGAA